MSKTLLPADDLRIIALTEMRKQQGCSGVLDVSIDLITDSSAENNWSMRVESFGHADVNTATRAAIYVQHALRRDYVLATD